ncbi:SigB/SigF/SigG family RNA polymerase sigma factor [Alkalibaculum sp. M08DMB]|uniref:SigB/SigF/SigG family RNA polymerase sigma factor n=1 Tax=Alkalibaculum sporogenes TaxID=2655001 RepID=A0A6A7K9X4_9FIRM|nr:SigB/SigF/SigG family RNA polymerase sigma factor [Alkalibaculum sporogenes]MPW26196.1 SigB/SigF/SigG family RNA polymerase sigma factor [Alkalibaculum sporogenes]
MNKNLSITQENKAAKRKKRIELLFKEYIDKKDTNLRNQIFEEYMYIAEILSKKYVNKGVDFEDIYQVASLGLIYAIERFDPSKGYEFSSFATPTILGEIKKYFRDKEWIIKVPRRIQDSYRKINQAKEALQHKLMRVPNVDDIAKYLDLSTEEVIEAMEGSYAYAPSSLDVKITNSSDDSDISLFEILGIEDNHIKEVEDKDFLRTIFTNLSEYDKKIIVDRFYNNKSQNEIATDLGVSQMTVSRLEKKILSRLREKINV